MPAWIPLRACYAVAKIIPASIHCQQVCAVCLGAAPVPCQGVSPATVLVGDHPGRSFAVRIYVYTSIRRLLEILAHTRTARETSSEMPACMRFAAGRTRCCEFSGTRHATITRKLIVQRQCQSTSVRNVSGGPPVQTFLPRESEKKIYSVRPNCRVTCAICANLRNCSGVCRASVQVSADANASAKRARSASVFVSVAQTSSAFSYSG